MEDGNDACGVGVEQPVSNKIRIRNTCPAYEKKRGLRSPETDAGVPTVTSPICGPSNSLSCAVSKWFS